MFKPIAESMPSPRNLPAARQPILISKDAAEALAIFVLGSYRAAEATDPNVFISTATAVICGFSEDVAKAALNPKTGLQTRSKWLPTISEIREACEQAAQAKADRERREQLAKHRVLLDTPRGLLPEPEAEPILEAERQRVLAGFAQLKRDIAAGALGGETAAPNPDKPPPGLTADAERQWWDDNHVRLIKKACEKPLPKLSAVAKATNAGRDWAAPDITYGPASQAPAEAAE
jgi:hypothetical protein